ncbi:hypothetical protein HAQ01_14035 [Acidithiobacillus thiooxidans]|uniref:hypothetical protein n=1 Tax=Acidithiobacillus TaxID=119977 RepID=UPI001C07318B|nr:MULTISPECIES: hypothetical protein [Acidithiobacillus]MBU2794476.1 hypothetical protein [Acidithiobacillus thiooxidans]
MKKLYPFFLISGLTGCLLPVPSFANDSLLYTLRGSGAASDYAFTSMVRPEFGLSLKISNAQHEYMTVRARLAAKNADPNGGVAGVFSIYAGDTFLNTQIATLPFSAGMYAGYQHLWYGPLYNNGFGGGLRMQTRILGLTLTGRVGALYGQSGTVGWHLDCPGNDFIFYGRATYPISRNFSVFAFVRQERYVGDGNSLTARDAGLGLQAVF